MTKLRARRGKKKNSTSLHLSFRFFLLNSLLSLSLSLVPLVLSPSQSQLPPFLVSLFTCSVASRALAPCAQAFLASGTTDESPRKTSNRDLPKPEASIRGRGRRGSRRPRRPWRGRRRPRRRARRPRAAAGPETCPWSACAPRRTPRTSSEPRRRRRPSAAASERELPPERSRRSRRPRRGPGRSAAPWRRRRRPARSRSRRPPSQHRRRTRRAERTPSSRAAFSAST